MARSPFRTRVGAAVAALLAFSGNSFVFPPPAMAQASQVREIYAHALKCFAANARAMNLRERAGDAAGVSRYDQGSRASFNTAQVSATTLGYSSARLNADLAATRDRELPVMVRDAAYYRSAVATCRTLGLMPNA